MDLIYCADGNKRFADIAIRYGFRYGAQLPNTVYYKPYFADQDWRDPNFDSYMSALKEHAPTVATVLDWEPHVDLAEVLRWAEAVARIVDVIVIIPKVMGGISQLPRVINGKGVRLGYSVPTRFAGTQVPIWEFMGWPIHLLGGSPTKQYELHRYLDIASADGNYLLKASMNNRFFNPGGHSYGKNRFWPQLQESVYRGLQEDTPYFAFELSCINIKSMWAGCTALIRFAVEQDIPHIRKIATKYRQELGYVSYPSLRRGIQNQELLVAEYREAVVGFCNFHKRQDGWSTIYEIAVTPERCGEHIGAGLLAGVPGDVQLKCPVDNQSNGFYEESRFTLRSVESGWKRELNVWERITP